MGLSGAEYASTVNIMSSEPNFLEKGIWPLMWSEHCGHKNSQIVLGKEIGEYIDLSIQGNQVLKFPLAEVKLPGGRQSSAV